MSEYLKIQIYDHDTGHAAISASNGTQVGYQEIYIDFEKILAFSMELMDFPRSITHAPSFELGGTGPTDAQYIKLIAGCHDSKGHSALRFIARDNFPPPNWAESNFFIRWEAAAINALGNQLKAWAASPSKENIFIFTPLLGS
jgi:hypothetical protein